MIGDLSALRCCRLAEGEIVLHYHQMAAIVADRDAYGHCSKLRRVIDRFDSTKLGVAARARRRLYLDNLCHISLASSAYRRAARPLPVCIWPEPLRIYAARNCHRRSPLSVAKTGERVALIVQAKTDTFTGRRKRRRFLLSGGNRRSLIPTRHGAPRKADHKESRVVVHWLMVDQGICHAAI